MQPIKQLRLWHAVLAVLATATYLAEDVAPLHQLLGYGVVLLVVIRLLMALSGAGALGLQRFYPKFHDLKLGTIGTHPAISRMLLLGIAVAVLGISTTGVLMDRGETLQSVPAISSGASLDGYLGGDDRHEEGDDEEGWLGEVHELFANGLIGLVGLHVTYLIVFKWPLARFMLFVRRPARVVVPKEG